MVRPVTVIGEEGPVAVTAVPTPTGVAVTVKPVNAEPPVLAGAVKLTTAPALLPLAAMPVGVPGAIAGIVTAAEAPDAVPVPMAFVAVTVNV